VNVNIGIVAFPAALQMDLTGPYGVFAAAPGATVDLLWKNITPVTTSDRNQANQLPPLRHLVP